VNLPTLHTAMWPDEKKKRRDYYGKKGDRPCYPVSPSLVTRCEVEFGAPAESIVAGSRDATERPMVPSLTLTFFEAGGSSPIFRLTDIPSFLLPRSGFFDSLRRGRKSRSSSSSSSRRRFSPNFAVGPGGPGV
jgi:hypothetical protein